MALQNTLTAGRGTIDRFQSDAIRLYSQLGAKAPLLLMGSGTSGGAIDAVDIFGPPAPSSVEVPNREDDPDTAQPPANDNSNIIAVDELQSLDATIEEYLDPDGTSALNLYEDIRVASRKVTRFAEKVLENTEEGEAPSYSEATASASPQVAMREHRGLVIGATRQRVALRDSFGTYHSVYFDQVKTWEASSYIICLGFL